MHTRAVFEQQLKHGEASLVIELKPSGLPKLRFRNAILWIDYRSEYCLRSRLERSGSASPTIRLLKYSLA